MNINDTMYLSIYLSIYLPTYISIYLLIYLGATAQSSANWENYQYLAWNNTDLYQVRCGRVRYLDKTKWTYCSIHIVNILFVQEVKTNII